MGKFSRISWMAALLGGTVSFAVAVHAQEAAVPPTQQNFEASPNAGGLKANSNSRTVMRNRKPGPGESATAAEREITRQLNLQQASLGNAAPGQEGMVTPNADLNTSTVDANKTPQTSVSAAATAQKTVRDPNNQVDPTSSAGKTPDVASPPAPEAAATAPPAQDTAAPAPEPTQ